MIIVYCIWELYNSTFDSYLDGFGACLPNQAPIHSNNSQMLSIGSDISG